MYRRHYSYREPGTLKEELGHTAQAAGDLLALTSLFLGIFSIPLIIGAIAGAANSAPIARKGQFCPMQYYRIGEYCAPSTRKTPSAVRIIDETCPIGTYTQSNYCMSLERAK